MSNPAPLRASNTLSTTARPAACLAALLALAAGPLRAEPTAEPAATSATPAISVAAATPSMPATPTAAAPSAKSAWSGTVGLGPMVFPKYTGGNGMRTWLVPLISASYGDTAYIEPLRAGAYLWGSDDRKMALGLAVEPRFGFQARDGARLAGMATRRNSLEVGPAFDWDLGVVAIDLSLFTDLTNSSRGLSQRLYVYREFLKDGRWKLNGFVGADRLGSRTANYFFGVAADEATAARPAYRPGASTNATLGLDGAYKLSRDYSLVFGLQAARLNGGIARSPIVATRQANLGWLGLAWNL